MQLCYVLTCVFALPAKAERRVEEALKRYRPLVEQAKARDVGEADTSALVRDIGVATAAPTAIFTSR